MALRWVYVDNSDDLIFASWHHLVFHEMAGIAYNLFRAGFDLKLFYLQIFIIYDF